ncbi:MAG TPA: DUF899 family protein [Candidatus Angelobacter sp.]|jgi:predicted dithiol-disulfide oxidoreductase (DUF899 family)
MPASLHSNRFPNENPEYREARDRLLEAEMALRRQTEAVAAMRRALPPGGLLKEDYVFEEGAADINDSTTIRKTHLSDLFSPGKDTLVIYSYMFGPQMAAPCVSCTSILDGLNGSAPHIRQRVNFAVVAKSPIARIRETARGRGWKNLRLLSSVNNTYNMDYHGESAKGDQLPSLNVFVRRDGKIYHTYNTELLFAPQEPGMDGRHVDSVWPIWNMFDFTPDGRGKDWYPKLSYEAPLEQIRKSGD